MTRKDYSEDQLIQLPAAELLEKELHWDSVFAFDKETFGADSLLGRLSDRETVLRRDVDAALRRLNPGLPEEAYHEALVQVMQIDTAKTLLQANEEKYELLKHGIPITLRDSDGRMIEKRLRLLDFDEPGNNRYLVVRELWVQGRLWRRRADLVGFVNGLPLVFIELKRFDKDIRSAFDGNFSDYKDTIPQLFHWNAFAILSNGLDGLYGSITTPWEHFSRWKRLDEDDPEPKKDQPLLPVLLRGMLDKTQLLDLVENFILFDRSEDEVQKIIARNHQFLGVNRVVNRLVSDDPEIKQDMEKGRLGVFWHTQGSGKSYSMAFLSEKIHRKLSAQYTFLVMTDRSELDGQIFRTFSCVGASTDKRAQARNGRGLESLLRQDHRYVFSLIHKFHSPPATPYSTRDDIIVISDEAHRTQYGRLALNMRKALPNAKFIGFTGTPLIENQDKQLTREIFGDYVSIYDFQRAVADGATLPLYYESRGESLHLVDPAINERITKRIDAAKERGELDEVQEERLYRKLARDYPILTSPKRLEKVAQDFVNHYHQRYQTGKALFVCLDKITCVKMFELIEDKWNKKIEELETWVIVEETRYAELGSTPDEDLQQLRVQVEWMKTTEFCVVISPEQGEVEEFKQWGLDIEKHREKMVKRKLELEFKKPENPFRVAIVCAMWLTGFDVKCLSTLYLDKPLRGHTLMQAIARANRVYQGKHNGLIIDYNGMLKSLRRALATFAKGNRIGKEGEGDEEKTLLDNSEALAEYADSIRLAKQHLSDLGFDLFDLMQAKGEEKQHLILLGANALCRTDESRKTYELLLADIQTRRLGLFPDPGLFEYDPEESALNALNRGIQKVRTAKDITAMLKSLYQLVDTAVGMTLEDKAVKKHARYDLTNFDFSRLQAEFERNCHHLKALSLREKLEQRLQAMIAANPTRVNLYERYLNIVKAYNQDKDAVAIQQVFDKLRKFEGELDHEERRYIRAGLGSEAQLAVFDLLTKDKLKPGEQEKIKKVAVELSEKLDSLMREIDHWREKASAQAKVKISIIDHLLMNLPPESYSNDEIEYKADLVFAHLFASNRNTKGAVVYH